MSEDIRLAIVTSKFNEQVTQALYEGAISRVRELKLKEENIKSVWVPGAVEIPLVAQKLLLQNCYDAIVCLGAVIRGETTHYDYVCQQVSDGCQKLALEYSIPVIFGILTTENKAQALDRCGGDHGHKGIDAIDTALEMVTLLRDL